MNKETKDRIQAVLDELESISGVLSGDEQELVEEAIDKLRSAIE